MSVALFGGTFDPVHTGHLLIAESAREAFGFKKIIFVPSGHPPHKNKPSGSTRHRLAMLRLAIRGNPAFSIDDWEIRQNRIVYTFETLRYFQAKSSQQKLAFIIGSDSLMDIRSWRESETLLRAYSFLVVERPEAPWTRVPAALRRKVRRVPALPVPFASHDIRRQAREGRSIRYQVPLAVERYIRKHRLYRLDAA